MALVESVKSGARLSDESNSRCGLAKGRSRVLDGVEVRASVGRVLAKEEVMHCFTYIAAPIVRRMNQPSIASVLAVAVLAAACGGVDNIEENDELSGLDEDVGHTSEAIINGLNLASEDYTGIVAIQAWNTWVNPPAHWSTFCSGGLMSNRVIVTAKHCLDDPPVSTVYAKMGNQRIALKKPYALHPNLDIAVAELASPMRMWNYNQGQPLTSPAKITLTGYVRGIYPGTNQSLNGASLMCFGFGGNSDAVPAPPLTYGAFNVTYGDGFNPVTEPHLQRTGGRMCQGGDSGMMCLDGLFRTPPRWR